jgi:cell wall-associated NlpC family hydrolase
MIITVSDTNGIKQYDVPDNIKKIVLSLLVIVLLTIGSLSFYVKTLHDKLSQLETNIKTEKIIEEKREKNTFLVAPVKNKSEEMVIKKSKERIDSEKREILLAIQKKKEEAEQLEKEKKLKLAKLEKAKKVKERKEKLAKEKKRKEALAKAKKLKLEKEKKLKLAKLEKAKKAKERKEKLAKEKKRKEALAKAKKLKLEKEKKLKLAKLEKAKKSKERKKKLAKEKKRKDALAKAKKLKLLKLEKAKKVKLSKKKKEALLKAKKLKKEKEQRKRVSLAKAKKLKKEKAKLAKLKNANKKLIKGITTKEKLLPAIAKSKLGKRYVWGAVGPGTFDCSGFTSYVYRKTGISIPRTSRQQSRYGKLVDRKHLKPGDLIFFDTSRRKRGYINHVGMYIGNNQFIHASSAKKRVVITNLKNFYSQRFKWARRVIN